MEHPVFGPDRPLAAVRAIAELTAARDMLDDFRGHYFKDAREVFGK